jgi:aerobic-type carbon monoxide dehydrogenase small subunit (CoxS/CutS family)
MANGNDLFDDEPADSAASAKPAKTKAAKTSSGGGPLRGGVTRRRFLVGAGTAAAAGAAVGTGVTVGVKSFGGGGGSDQTTTAVTAINGVSVGVPDGQTIAKAIVHLNVNGKDEFVSVMPNQSLAEVLRENLGMTGTKVGCDRSECGACTVLIDGVPHNSCSALAIREEGKKIVTVEGLAKGTTLSAVQAAFMDQMGYQCGFCTAGQMLQATALLQTNPNPDEAAIRHALSGNLCKCAGYPNIVAAVQAAAKATKA